MTIREMKALSMAEASEYTSEETGAFIKKFTKMKASEAVKIREEIEALGNIKIKSEHAAKVVDLMPEDAQDLNKIFVEVSLDENEANQILEILKKYR